MSTLVRGIILSGGILYSTIHTPLHAAHEHSTAQTVFITCAAVAGGIAAFVGIAKLCEWAYYYEIDRTPLPTFITKFSYQVEAVQLYLSHYQEYRLGNPVASLIHHYYRNQSEQYPMLKYYDTLSKVANDVYYLQDAFRRKKSKTQDVNEMYLCDTYILELERIREHLQQFKNDIYNSSAYQNEHRAKYPPVQQPIIIVHHHEIH